jgi:hypothetical protein
MPRGSMVGEIALLNGFEEFSLGCRGLFVVLRVRTGESCRESCVVVCIAELELDKISRRRLARRLLQLRICFRSRFG